MASASVPEHVQLENVGGGVVLVLHNGLNVSRVCVRKRVCMVSFFETQKLSSKTQHDDDPSFIVFRSRDSFLIKTGLNPGCFGPNF
jgi:hypothetical protein